MFSTRPRYYAVAPASAPLFGCGPTTWALDRHYLDLVLRVLHVEVARPFRLVRLDAPAVMGRAGRQLAHQLGDLPLEQPVDGWGVRARQQRPRSEHASYIPTVGGFFFCPRCTSIWSQP